MGIFRHVDAGYSEAVQCAKDQGVQIPLEAIIRD
jgi:urocanate hydratase